MDRFKAILKRAVQAQALSLTLRDGGVAEIVTSLGTQSVPDTSFVDAAFIQSLFDSLLVNEKATLSLGQPARGLLNVVGVGKIQLLASPVAPMTLALYLPLAPQTMLDSDWEKLRRQSQAPALISPLPPAPGEISQGFIPKLSNEPAAAPEVKDALFKLQPFGESPVPVPEIAHTPSEARALEPPKKVTEAGKRLYFGPYAPGEVGASGGSYAIDEILREMTQRRASDLHMTLGEPLCFRIDGDIVRTDRAPTSEAEMERLLMPLMPPRNQAEFADGWDTDFAYQCEGVGRFRVNMFRDHNGVGAVLRHIPSKVLSAEQLGLPPSILKFCTLSKGLVVVTGPTGSGKSTTLAAMIDYINSTRRDHLLTIEDPIEFVHKQKLCLVNHREVGKHTKSFARALKAALREDPDIILIGEMRDLETVAIAIETAETGHLVFGTLHTTTAVSTVDRIIDQFPADQQQQIRMMLASSLKGVVAQTLLKKKGGGRVAAHEILVLNDAVSAMIREGKNHMIANHMQSQKQDGNQMLNEALFNLVVQGIVEPQEAYLKTVAKKELLDMMRRKGISTAAIDGGEGEAEGKAPPAPKLPKAAS